MALKHKVFVTFLILFLVSVAVVAIMMVVAKQKAEHAKAEFDKTAPPGTIYYSLEPTWVRHRAVDIGREPTQPKTSPPPDAAPAEQE